MKNFSQVLCGSLALSLLLVGCSGAQGTSALSADATLDFAAPMDCTVAQVGSGNYLRDAEGGVAAGDRALTQESSLVLNDLVADKQINFFSTTGEERLGKIWMYASLEDRSCGSKGRTYDSLFDVGGPFTLSIKPGTQAGLVEVLYQKSTFGGCPEPLSQDNLVIQLSCSAAAKSY